MNVNITPIYCSTDNKAPADTINSTKTLTKKKTFQSYKGEIMSYNQGNDRKHDAEKSKCCESS